MKKYSKFILAIAVAVSIFLLYTYVLFDHEPFDDLKAGEIEKVYLFTDGKTEYYEVTDYSAFTDRVEELELIKRTTEVNEEHQGRVSVTIYYRNGREQRFSVTPDYIQTDDDIFIGDREDSVEFLKYAFSQTLFGQDIMSQADKSRVDELIQLAIDGKSSEDIRDWAKTALISGGMSEDMLKSFANQGYSPTYIYVLKSEERQRLESHNRYNTRKTQYRLLTEQLWQNYKNGNIVYQYPYTQPPMDFVFGDVFDDKAMWDTMEFQQDEMGYFYTVIPSADGKYNMTVTIDDSIYENMFGTVVDDAPFVKFVNFYLQSDSVIPADYPPVDIIKNNTALESADILTDYITSCMDTASVPENAKFSKMMFLCSIHYIDNPNFCYYNIFPLFGSNTQFKPTNMEKVIRQVFGDYQWNALTDFGEPPNGGFNEKTLCYEFSTDFGWGVMFWSADNISSSFSTDGKQVYSTFDLRGPDPEITTDPTYKDYGKYRAVYDIITENGETFLRFNKYEKI